MTGAHSTPNSLSPTSDTASTETCILQRESVQEGKLGSKEAWAVKMVLEYNSVAGKATLQPDRKETQTSVRVLKRDRKSVV